MMTSVAAAHSTLCIMHSHADTREHCMLRDTETAIVRQIILEYVCGVDQ